MTERDDLSLWRTLHDLALTAYNAAAANCTNPHGKTPAGFWTADEVMQHVRSEHSETEGTNTDDLVQLQMLTLDLAVHSWDIARSQEMDPHLGDDLCRRLHDAFAPYTHLMAQDGAFAPPVPVGTDASPIARLVALCGRDPSWAPER